LAQSLEGIEQVGQTEKLLIVQAVSLCSELTGMLHCSEAVIVNGTKYAKDDVVIIGSENGFDAFGKVVVCLMDSSDTST